MLAVTRLRLPVHVPDGGPADARGTETLLLGVLDLLAARPGFVSGRVGRSVDQPALLLLVTEWSGAGAYRRALSGYDVKVAFADLMAYVDNEPSAFEVVAAR
ncbi:MAG TPA: antibiotic biosynthesis monooxygenase [Actinomycetes bacterium]|nr:antibiotic biosynthesis monooxygenase [Actinomycetes bacterium]